MYKNRHLSKTVAQQKFFEFRIKLTAKCKEYGIELILVDRTYICSKCGYTADRDFNASLNLRDCLTYQIT